MAEQRIPVTILNHVAIDIAVSPDVLWRAILDDYATGEKFGSAGYEISELDDPGAVLGGYRMRLHKDGALVDDRMIAITERDEAARRLSIRADYLTMPGGFQVYVTYQSHEVPGGARYTLDCHTRMAIEASAGGSKAELAKTMAETKAQFDTHLNGFFQSIKAKLEAAG